MRQKVVCAEGSSAEEAESTLNQRLLALGPNYQTLSVQGSGINVRGQPGILLVAMVSITAENNIGYWPLDKLDLTAEELKELAKLVGPEIANVHDLIMTCGIRKTLGKNRSLLRAVTSALGKHGLCLSEN